VAATQAGNLSIGGIISQVIAGGAGGSMLTAIIGAMRAGGRAELSGKKGSFAQGALGADAALARWRADKAPQAARDEATADKPAPLSAPDVKEEEPEPISAPAQGVKRARIFVSYRREGDAIRLGVDFVEVINEEVAKCDVLLALIGRSWLDAQNEADQRVLDNPDDFVRLEIAAALKRKIPVIPILVDGAKIPPANRLPEELQGLARRNALDLRNASFKADMDRLVQQLKTSKSS
jgi:TIR domain